MQPLEVIPGDQSLSGWRARPIQRYDLVRLYRDQGRVRLPFRIMGDYPLYRPGESQALASRQAAVVRFVLVHDEQGPLDEISPREVHVGILRDCFIPVEEALSGKITLPTAIDWLATNHWAELIERILEES